MALPCCYPVIPAVMRSSSERFFRVNSPPSSEELRLRPMDVSALIDAVDAGQLLSEFSVDTDPLRLLATRGVPQPPFS